MVLARAPQLPGASAGSTSRKNFTVAPRMSFSKAASDSAAQSPLVSVSQRTQKGRFVRAELQLAFVCGQQEAPLVLFTAASRGFCEAEAGLLCVAGKRPRLMGGDPARHGHRGSRGQMSSASRCLSWSIVAIPLRMRSFVSVDRLRSHQ